eukprot:scaffold23738_cov67-Phaeocystis_antarctica.AAC.2
MGAFHPALCPGSASARNRDAWCWVGALAHMVFIMGMTFGVPNSPFFSRCAGGSQSVRSLTPPPFGPGKKRVSPVGRSTGSSSSLEAKRHLS